MDRLGSRHAPASPDREDGTATGICYVMRGHPGDRVARITQGSMKCGRSLPAKAHTNSQIQMRDAAQHSKPIFYEAKSFIPLVGRVLREPGGQKRLEKSQPVSDVNQFT